MVFYIENTFLTLYNTLYSNLRKNFRPEFKFQRQKILHDKGEIQNMNIAICDDSMEYVNTLENYIDTMRVKNLNHDVFYSGEALLDVYQKDVANYDAIFLDMEMEGLDGIETANFIRQMDRHVIIVFVTSHTKYMQRSFECMPFRFLTKPLGLAEFEKVFHEVCIKLEDDPETFIFLENKIRTRIFCSDIIFFESSAHSILIYTRDGTVHKTRKTMTELLASIQNSTFFRVHRAFVINLRYIHQITELKVILHHHTKPIPVSRTYTKDLEDAFLHFKERKYLL